MDSNILEKKFDELKAEILKKFGESELKYVADQLNGRSYDLADFPLDVIERHFLEELKGRFPSAGSPPCTEEQKIDYDLRIVIMTFLDYAIRKSKLTRQIQTVKLLCVKCGKRSVVLAPSSSSMFLCEGCGESFD